MSKGLPYQSDNVPPRALVFSLASFAVPILGALVFPDHLGEAGALLWLVALIPAFLLAYYRGWRGVATSLAGGMAAISVTQVLATIFEREIPDLLFWIVIAYLGIAIGIGWVAELLHRQRADVEDLALTDILTHLPNRRHARIFLENEFGAAERGRALSVVLFDLDHFKEYNDRYGHQAGDEGLKLFAEILASTTRRMNLSARFGGEEFLTILAGSEEEGALVFAERVREALLTLRLPHGALTVSGGVASYHPSMRSSDELIAAADLALYRAKRDGRNCVRVFGRPLDLPMPEGGAEFPEVEEEGAAVARGAGAAGAKAGGGVRGGAGAGSGAKKAEDVLTAGVVGEAFRGDGDRGTSTGGASSDDRQDAADPKRAGYPRPSEEMGKSAPPSSMLPPSVLRFGEGRHILVVEDEDPIRTLITTYLKREGFSVVEAPDSAGAIRALGHEFDVVITDIRLPGPSGNELVGVVKSRWPMTQVIVITGFRDAHVAAEALNAGADRYLFKPFGMPELQGHLIDALARRDRVLTDRRERQHLTEEARRRGDEARDAILRGARALVTAVEVRDLYTRGHSTRVAEYAVFMANQIGSKGEKFDLDQLRIACELHDVGKIGVPDAILNKPGALSAEEFFQVQRHPGVGRRILEPLFGDELVLAVTGWHHERWDGDGYPDRLAGDAIPLGARLVAFADALDAMTTGRAYRPALPWADAVRQIRERAGSQFDPHLMDLFDASLSGLEDLYRKMPAD